ncbi:hypothetical protein BKI52_38835 [marine bacterium AO1-C]|nr:hypothetical protein BKI52_38835 [marine bacterium AO1-C]
MQYKPEDGFPYYFELAKGEDLYPLFASPATYDFFKSIDEAKASHRYAPDKWSIKQVIGHITDHEKIKMFRAFQLSRGEQIELWGYDQNLLVNNARFDEVEIEKLITDFSNVRKASLSFIEMLSEAQLQINGSARQHQVTLQEFLRSIIGHERHHVNILKERYL